MKVLISGGGTGGHIYPAIAIADALKEVDKNIDILFIGSNDRMEMEKVPKAGYPIQGLWISGIQRSLSLKNLSFPFKLVSSLWKSRKIIKQFKPDVAVGVGGYASGPALMMASRMNVPCLLQEQNSYPGITNKLLAGKAEKICVAYPKMEKFFAKEKLVHTGNPVRKDLLDLTEKFQEALKHFDFVQNKKTILLFGGSLGSGTLNRAMRENVEQISAMEDVQILWQMGKAYTAEFSECETAKLPNVKATTFIDRMDLAYAMADIVICRAGALTISELALVGKPAILVPSPIVAEDHQTKNAQALVDQEAAIMIKDNEFEKALIPKAKEVLKNEMLQNNLLKNIQSFAKPNAAKDIAQMIIQLAK